VKGMKRKGYNDKLRELRIIILENRKLRRDLIETGTILNGFGDIHILVFERVQDSNTIEHEFKLTKSIFKTDSRKHFLSQRELSIGSGSLTFLLFLILN